MNKKLQVIDDKEICENMLVKKTFELLETGKISKDEMSQILECRINRLVEIGELSEEEADRYIE